jgi:hypothetical protein
MQARPVAQRADALDRIVRKLRERLATEARSAGTEDHDVAGVGREARPGVADGMEIIMPFRQPQERQCAVGVARADPVERGRGARQRVVECGVVDAVGSDALLARVLDRLVDWHDWLTLAPNNLRGRGVPRKRTYQSFHDDNLTGEP